MMQDGCVRYTTTAWCTTHASSWDCSYYKDYYDGDTWPGYALNDCEECATDDCNFDTILVTPLPTLAPTTTPTPASPTVAPTELVLVSSALAAATASTEIFVGALAITASAALLSA